MKTCRACGIEKDEALFHPHGGGRRRPDCRQCHQVKKRAYNKAYVERDRKRYSRMHRINNMKRTYGLTVEQYNAIAKAQNYECKICGVEAWTQRHGKLHIDHCHSTKVVRGLLCYSCNVGIGHFKDSPNLLVAAAAYLSKCQT